MPSMHISCHYYPIVAVNNLYYFQLNTQKVEYYLHTYYRYGNFSSGGLRHFFRV